MRMLPNAPIENFNVWISFSNPVSALINRKILNIIQTTYLVTLSTLKTLIICKDFKNCCELLSDPYETDISTRLAKTTKKSNLFQELWKYLVKPNANIFNPASNIKTPVNTRLI